VRTTAAVILRDALVSHRKTIGSTFDLGGEEARYLEAAQRLASGDVRFVVFGHTHLAKHVPLGKGRTYLNTGTWCPTIRLDERLYQPGANDEEARRLLRRFVADMGKNQLGNWASLQTVFARISVDGGGATTAELCEFQDDGHVVILSGPTQ
jgi:hypothetical protein